MTTVTAVVSTQEETERGAAGRGVAIGRCFVGLWEVSNGKSFNGRTEGTQELTFQ